MAKEKVKAVEGSVDNPEVKQKKPVKKESELDKFKTEQKHNWNTQGDINQELLNKIKTIESKLARVMARHGLK